MQSGDEQVQAEVAGAAMDAERPSSARMYDYYLGGAHNFAVDRRYAQQIIAIHPEVPQAAQANRAFLRRAVQVLVDAGVRQFLDIGSGIPTVGHVHEIAQATTPESRVVYVDIDPVAVAHSRDILRGNDRTVVIQEDVRRPDRIIAHHDVRRLLDFDEPVAVLVVALFHFVTDDAGAIVAELMAPLPSGSYLVLSHGTADGVDEDSPGFNVYRGGSIDVVSRTHAEVTALFDGLELVAPGVVWGPQWRPEPGFDTEHPERSMFYAGVGRKP